MSTLATPVAPGAGSGRPHLVLAGSAVVNLAASLALLLPLRDGTMVGGGAPERMAFIASHAGSWSAGWLCWMAATLSLVAFFWVLVERCEGTPGRALGRLALLLLLPGASMDLLHDALQAVVVRGLAESRVQAATFLLVDDLTVVLGGGIVNLMYGLAGLALTWALAAAGTSRAATLQGLALWVTTLALAAAGFVGNPLLLVATTAATMAQFVLYAFTMAWRLRPR